MVKRFASLCVTDVVFLNYINRIAIYRLALGKKFGVTAVLVLSGATKADDVDAASTEDKPDLVFESLAEVDKDIFNLGVQRGT